MTDRKNQSGELLELIDDLLYRRDKEIEKILVLKLAKREGLLEEPISYNIDEKILDLVIDGLADIVFNLHNKNKKKKKNIPIETLVPLLKIAQQEIDLIYESIKKIGFKGSIADRESKHKKAALNCFDDSSQCFEAIKREYLEEDDTYILNYGQEHRDFKSKMLKRIVGDNLPLKAGGRRILKEFRDKMKQTDQF